MTYAVLATLSGGCPPLKGRLSTCYSPVRRFTQRPKPPFSLDLHVLSPPLTFALSQDQTLHLKCLSPARHRLLAQPWLTGLVLVDAPSLDGANSSFFAIQFSETDSTVKTTTGECTFLLRIGQGEVP